MEELGIDYFERRNKMVNAVTADDVSRAAKRFLADSKLLVIMVGRPVPLSKSNGG